MQDIPIDENTFIVEVTDMEVIIPRGSLCVFRGGVASWRDGDLVLVQNGSFPDQNSYCVKRYRGQEKHEKDGLLYFSTWLESLNSGEQYQSSGYDEYIVAQFICILE